MMTLHDHPAPEDEDEESGVGCKLLSKTQQKKNAKHQRGLEYKKSKRKLEQVKSREKFKEQRQLGGPSKDEIRSEQLSRMEAAKGVGIKVCIDFQFEHLMIEKELNHLVNQAKRVYSSNKSSSNPFDLHFINLKKSSKTYSLCCEKNTGFENYPLTFSENGAEEISCEDQIVYLSPDSDNVLENLSPDSVYVIGGLVDDSVKKNTSLTFCQEARITSSRLPIPEYMCRAQSGGSFKQILTINQVFDVLLSFHETGDWSLALSKNVPAKTGFVLR